MSFEPSYSVNNAKKGKRSLWKNRGEEANYEHTSHTPIMLLICQGKNMALIWTTNGRVGPRGGQGVVTYDYFIGTAMTFIGGDPRLIGRSPVEVELGDRGTEMEKGDTSSEEVYDKTSEGKGKRWNNREQEMLVIEYEIQSTDLHQSGCGKRPPTHTTSVGVDISAFKSDYCLKKLSPRLVFHKTLLSI